MLGEVQMNETIILLILLAVVVFVFFYLIWEINVCLNTFIYARQKKKMFKSLENILLSYYNKKDTSACFEEINLVFKHIVDKNEELKRKAREDLIEHEEKKTEEEHNTKRLKLNALDHEENQ